MVKFWITSDLHLGHTNIIKYCSESRPFVSSEEMDEKIISNWNSVIDPEDCVYILGDVAFCNAEEASHKLNRMNGTKVLIAGNHDHKLKSQHTFVNCFSFVTDYMETNFEGSNLILFHYPIESWNRMSYGSIMLHGHKHGTPTNTKGKIKDVGIDTNNMFPYLLSDVIKEMQG